MHVASDTPGVLHEDLREAPLCAIFTACPSSFQGVSARLQAMQYDEGALPDGHAGDSARSPAPVLGTLCTFQRVLSKLSGGDGGAPGDSVRPRSTIRRTRWVVFAVCSSGAQQFVQSSARAKRASRGDGGSPGDAVRPRTTTRRTRWVVFAVSSSCARHFVHCSARAERASRG